MVRATAVGGGDSGVVEPVKITLPTVEGEDPFRSYLAAEMASAIRAWKDSGLNAPVRNTTQGPEGAAGGSGSGGGEAAPKTAPVLVPKAMRVNPVAEEGAVKESAPAKPVPKLDF